MIKIDNTKLFKESVGPSTLLAPTVRNYPVMDFALIGEQTVYIFQLTLGRQSEKPPYLAVISYAILLWFLLLFN